MRSDWRALAKYYLQGPAALDRVSHYKACVALAVHGKALGSEEALSAPERQLLSARRSLFGGEFVQAKQKISGIDFQLAPTELIDLLRGDQLFLEGVITQREGSFAGAMQCLGRAGEYLLKSEDAHRFLRNEINRELCAESLTSFYLGRLHFLRKEAENLGLYDLVGNIRKAQACQLMDEGRFLEAEDAAHLATVAYGEDGSAEDEAVAYCVLALARLNLGDFPGAQAAILKVRTEGGKVAIFRRAYDSLLEGKRPMFPQGHPLSATNWSLSLLKPNAVSAKIIRALEAGPKSTHEIIDFVWGAQATHPSYKDRLHSALRQIRRHYGVPVRFDGSQYQIIRS